MTTYNVYYDKSRLLFMSLMYVIYIILMGMLIIYIRPNIFVILFLIFLTVIFGYLIYSNVKNVFKDNLKYEISDEGITSFVVQNDKLIFNWLEVVKIEVVQIDYNYKISILALKKNPQTNESNYYSMMIDGFYFRITSFEKLYNKLKSTAVIHNKEIIFEECKGYKDTHRSKKYN